MGSATAPPPALQSGLRHCVDDLAASAIKSRRAGRERAEQRQRARQEGIRLDDLAAINNQQFGPSGTLPEMAGMVSVNPVPPATAAAAAPQQIPGIPGTLRVDPSGLRACLSLRCLPLRLLYPVERGLEGLLLALLACSLYRQLEWLAEVCPMAAGGTATTCWCMLDAPSHRLRS